MNRFQSWSREVEGQTKRSKIAGFFNAPTWRRAMRYRKQRLQKGFSDQDMWAGGEYIMGMISDSLKWFEKEGIADWEFTFEQWKEEKTNYGYDNLKQMYTDIDNYLEHDRSSWARGLTTDTSVANEAYIDKTAEKKNDGALTIVWVEEATGKVLTEKQITKRMTDFYKVQKGLHKKATNALMCWSRHAVEFWD